MDGSSITPFRLTQTRRTIAVSKRRLIFDSLDFDIARLCSHQSVLNDVMQGVPFQTNSILRRSLKRVQVGGLPSMLSLLSNLDCIPGRRVIHEPSYRSASRVQVFLFENRFVHLRIAIESHYIYVHMSRSSALQHPSDQLHSHLCSRPKDAFSRMLTESDC